MHKYLNTFLFAISALTCLNAGDKSKMLQDLDIIKSTFETKYAPYEWKKSYFGWSLDEEISIAKVKILSLNALSVKDYQKILHAFFISTCDYHVSDSYHSTEMAMLPFEVKCVNGKYFITKTHDKLLKLMQKSGEYSGLLLPQIGDELLLFDGRPVNETIEDLKYRELGNPSSKTAQTLAERLLTKRMGYLAHLVPQGAIQISFKTPVGEIVDSAIEWLYLPEKISNPSYFLSPAPFKSLFAKQAATSFETDEASDDVSNLEAELTETSRLLKPNLMINPVADALQKDHATLFSKLYSNEKSTKLAEEASDKTNQSGIERSKICFGTKVWEETPKSAFNAHIYELPASKKRIGYIRIGTYSPSNDESTATQMVIRLAKSIRFLESQTEALVVDQVDNPGGMDLYALAIASMLTDRPLVMPKNHLRLTQAEVAKALDTIEAFEEVEDSLPETITSYKPSSFVAGYPVNKHFIRSIINYQTFIIDQWNQGKTLTDAYPLSGIENLHPHPLASYSKPIVVLVNSNDFSCADIFPAILQDNQRAVIFGEQTAGAGGFVEQHSYPNSFGLAGFSYTASIAERLDGSVIENLGVTPDVPYELTQNDLLNGYQDYIQAVNQTVGNLLKN